MGYEETHCKESSLQRRIPGMLTTMSLDPELLQILACPKDKGELEYDQEQQRLINRRLGIWYRIEDGIPVLLPDEAQPLES